MTIQDYQLLRALLDVLKRETRKQNEALERCVEDLKRWRIGGNEELKE